MSDYFVMILRSKNDMSSTSDVFATIAANLVWGGGETICGPGSTLRETEKLRRELPELLTKLGIRTIVDAPCGDRNWIRKLEYIFDKYVGIDIVPKILNRIEQTFLPINYSVQLGNLITDTLPKVDAVFCRDCLGHLTNGQISRALRNFKDSGVKYLLTTTFPDHTNNPDVEQGDWRPVNLQAPPFGLPMPIDILHEREHDADDPCCDKAIGVWRLEDIVLYDDEDFDRYLDLSRIGEFSLTRALVKHRSIDFQPRGNSSVDSWLMTNRIVQFWDTDHPPKDVDTLIEGWRAAVPSGNHILFNQLTARDFIKANFPKVFVDAYDACHHPAMKSDLFRYAFLYISGGMYVDADENIISELPYITPNLHEFVAVSPIAFHTTLDGNNVGIPFDEMLDPGIFPPPIQMYYANAPIIATARHPVIKAALHRSVRLITMATYQKERCDIHGTTGPTNLTSVINASMLRASLCSDECNVYAFNWHKYSTTIDCEYKRDGRNWRRPES
jgi:hypothetical protein